METTTPKSKKIIALKQHISYICKTKHNTMSKQTAVEWLIEQVEQYILTHGNLPFNVLSNFKKQAKAMEIDQIIEVFYDGEENARKYKSSPALYYNETYKGGEQ